MNFNKLLLTDTAGNKSSTLTVFILGAVVVNLKLIFSGMYGFSEFSGSDYALALSALGGIYILRRNTNVNTNNSLESKENDMQGE